ncbi:hypothetical protein MARPU_06030 [Marichromatium purpuratum 984]|uniref:Uncharacterized protein n=1 Tax=Marichromatium purpuratum 984 TaxID=765910 RepID=W0E3U8_MARPU|nr:hypothetical protein [Marichromatium purpuratum]AHF05432.1 hypothetical protein MARPU_06030 [Marichromatium purpuratum 984]
MALDISPLLIGHPASLLVLAGLLLLLLALVGRIGRMLELSRVRQRWALLIGAGLTLSGLLLYPPTPPEQPSDGTPLGSTAAPTVPQTPECRATSGPGDTPPAIAIDALLVEVNRNAWLIEAGQPLEAKPGDLLAIESVILCVPTTTDARAGSAHVEFTPVDTQGRTITPAVAATRARPLIPGRQTLPGPGKEWRIGADWRHLSVTLVHYPDGGGTANPDCEQGACEIDDRLILPFD